MLDDQATKLIYSSASEFLDQGDTVDILRIEDNNGIQADIGGALSITDSDEFDNVRMKNATVLEDRGAAREGLILLLLALSLLLRTLFRKMLTRLLLVLPSAGTTGNSVIGNSAAVLASGDPSGSSQGWFR